MGCHLPIKLCRIWHERIVYNFDPDILYLDQKLIHNMKPKNLASLMIIRDLDILIDF